MLLLHEENAIIFLSCGGRSLDVYVCYNVAFTLTHETLWNSLSEAKVSVNLRKVSWLGLLLVGGRTIREGGDQLCAGAGRHSIKGVQQQLPPIHQEQWTSQSSNFVLIYFGGADFISHPISDRIRRYLFRYYWKVIWNFTRDSLLACQLYDIFTISNHSNVGKHRPRGYAAIAVFNFCHFVALGKCEYLLHVQRIAIHLNCTSQLGDCLNSHEIHENYFSPPCIHSLHPRVAPAGIHWDPLVSAGYPPQNKGRGKLALAK